VIATLENFALLMLLAGVIEPLLTRPRAPRRIPAPTKSEPAPVQSPVPPINDAEAATFAYGTPLFFW
jgi:hypothetical protein